MTTPGAKSRRDRMIIAIVVVVALYALAVVMWFSGRGMAWTNARKGYERERNRYLREKALIHDRALWEERAEMKRLRMPTVADGTVSARRWERVIEDLTTQYHVNTGKGLKASEDEENHGGVWEVPVEVKFDNTSLQRLVEFLYAVNTAKGAIMDVRELEVSVRGKNVGAMNGKMVLTCAYIKGDEPEEKTK